MKRVVFSMSYERRTLLLILAGRVIGLVSRPLVCFGRLLVSSGRFLQGLPDSLSRIALALLEPKTLK